MDSPAKNGESSRTQSTFFVPAQSEAYEPTTVVNKDEGYLPSMTVSKHETEEADSIEGSSTTSTEPSSSPSSVASSILGLKDRLQKWKESLVASGKLTSDQEREIQEIIIDMGKLEARHTIDSTTKSSCIVDWLRSSGTGSVESDELPYGTMDTEDHTHRPDPITLSEDDVEKAQKWSKESMKKMVAEIYHTGLYRFPDSLQLWVASNSLQMVVEAICKVMCIEDPRNAQYEAAIHVESFLEAFKDEKPGIPNTDVVAKMRNSVAHGNSYYEDDELKMYNRRQYLMKCTEIHTCTKDEFIKLSAKMRALFLEWPKISEYLPKESMVKMAEEEVGK